MKQGRRTYDLDFKKALVAQVLEGGFSATAVAKEHGLNPGVVQRWVALAREGKPLSAQEAKRLEAERQEQLVEAQKIRDYDQAALELEQAKRAIAILQEENERLKRKTALLLGRKR